MPDYPRAVTSTGAGTGQIFKTYIPDKGRQLTGSSS